MMNARMLAEMQTLRSWAEQNYKDTLTFWLEFADRTCAFMRGKRADAWRVVSDMYAEFEARSGQCQQFTEA